MSLLKQAILLLLPLFIFSTGLLAAQGSIHILTLQDACALAEQNSISLQKQAIDLNMDRIRAKNLWAQIFPSINVRGRAGYYLPNTDPPRTDPSYSASLNLSLGFNAGLPFTMANISLAYKNSLINYEQAKRILVNQTTISFYSLVSQKNNLDVLETIMRFATEQLGRDRVSRQNGLMGEQDFLSAQSSAERAKINYNRAFTDYQNSLARFLIALGLDHNEQVELQGNVEIPPALSLDAQRLIDEKLMHRPDIVVQRNEVNRLKHARTESQLAAKGPQLDLGASWGATPDKGLDDAASANITLTIPVDPWIPGTRQAQNAKRSSAEYEKALLELQNTENNARQDIYALCNSIRNTWAEVESARLQAGYAQRAYNLAAQSYRSGSMNFNNFETSRTRYTEAQQQQLQSELNYMMLVLDLASSLNMTQDELMNYSR